MPLPYCVYVLLSLSDHNIYVGYTTDLPRRLDARGPTRKPRLLEIDRPHIQRDGERLVVQLGGCGQPRGTPLVRALTYSYRPFK